MSSSDCTCRWTRTCTCFLYNATWLFDTFLLKRSSEVLLLLERHKNAIFWFPATRCYLRPAALIYKEGSNHSYTTLKLSFYYDVHKMKGYRNKITVSSYIATIHSIYLLWHIRCIVGSFIVHFARDTSIEKSLLPQIKPLFEYKLAKNSQFRVSLRTSGVCIYLTNYINIQKA